MHRLTARSLLLLILMGAFSPVLEALSARAPHACCLQKMHGTPAQNGVPGLHEEAVHQGNCCPPMTTPHSAHLAVVPSSIAAIYSAGLELLPADQHSATASLASHSSRAPPVFS
jgi:hypothetical protein